MKRKLYAIICVLQYSCVGVEKEKPEDNLVVSRKKIKQIINESKGFGDSNQEILNHYPF